MILNAVLVTFSVILQQICANEEHQKGKEIKAMYFSSEEEMKKFIEHYDYSTEYDENGEIPRFLGDPIEFGTKTHAKHMNHLKAVQGFKQRNMYIRETEPENPYYYMVNPIEANFPHPMMTVSDVKDILKSRIQLQKDILAEKNRFRLKQLHNPRLDTYAKG